MLKRSVLDYEKDGVQYGHLEEYNHDSWQHKPNTEWIKYPSTVWSKSAKDILVAAGIETTERRAREFEDIHECSSDAIYYMAIANEGLEDDYSLKLVMSMVLEELNARKMRFNQVSQLIPARYLNLFVKGLKEEKFPKTFTKQILLEIFDFPKYMLPEQTLARFHLLYIDPRFQQSDSSESLALLERIVKNNPEQVEKMKENPKIMQWFVGQMMKETQGKANPSEILKILESRYGR